MCIANAFRVLFQSLFILQYLYDNKDDFCNIRVLSENQFDIYDETLVESIADEIYQRDWATQSNHYNLSMRIKQSGRAIIDSHGSYSSFIRSENVSQKNKLNAEIRKQVQEEIIRRETIEKFRYDKTAFYIAIASLLLSLITLLLK